MKKLSEEKLLQELDIPDWRHMSKDKIMTFASSLPFLEPEVAKAAIGQFPEFSKMGNSIVAELRASLDTVASEGSDVTKHAFELNNRILNSLDKRLNKTLLLPGEREKIIDAMIKVSNNIAELDKNHKTFLANGLKAVGSVAIGVTVVGAAILGINIKKS